MILLLFEVAEKGLYPIHEMAQLPSPALPRQEEGAVVRLKKARVYKIFTRILNRNDKVKGTVARLKARVYKSYAALQERFDYQEKLCSQLRHASELEIYYPASWTKVKAGDRFRKFLRYRLRKHSGWLCVDALLALLGVGMTLLPGPNVFFLYPAIRSLSHYLARKGVLHALGLNSISFRAEPRIDAVQNQPVSLSGIDETLRELEECYNLKNLKSQLATARKQG